MIQTKRLERKGSKRVWTLYCDGEALCSVGVRKTSFLGTHAEVWFVPRDSFLGHKRLCIKFLRRALKRLLAVYKRLKVNVDHDFVPGRRFAKFFGFEPVSSIYTIDHRTFDTFELRA